MHKKVKEAEEHIGIIVAIKIKLKRSIFPEAITQFSKEVEGVLMKSLLYIQVNQVEIVNFKIEMKNFYKPEI